MMTFIIMTLSFTVALLLASVLAFVLMLNKHVMKWYMNKVQKMTMNLIEASFEEEEKTEETV